MGKRLQVDTDGLEADGRDLAAIGNVPKTEQCPHPATDPVSTSMAFAMSALDEGFVQRLQEAKEVREHGGAIVTASGVMFEVADEQGSLEIDRVEVLGAPRPAGADPPAIYQPKQPEPRATPQVPAVQPQSMDAESFVEAVHSGQGSGVVRDFGKRWTKAADGLDYQGDRTRRIGDSIQEHWRDADSNAAPNVRKHGTWLHDASEWSTKFGKSAETVATAFEIVRADTPTPTQLKTAEYALKASPVLGPAAVLVAYMNYESLKSKATEAGARYQASVQSAVKDVGGPPPSAPLIAKRAAIPGELVKGPGTWVSKSRTSGDWRTYEQQVTGYPAGMEYEVDGPNGPVAFDGYDDGVLVEAKGRGYDWMVGPDGRFDPTKGPAVQIPTELANQYEAAAAAGIPVEWRVADARTAGAIQAIIDQENYGDLITVTVVPPA